MELIEEFTNGNRKLRIYRDPEPLDPRETDNIGVMMCKHQKYLLGDSDFVIEQNKGSKVVTKLVLYLLDHSGLAINTSQFNNPWDSGKVGTIYATENSLKKMGYDPSKIDEETVKKWLKAEVKEYNQFLQGDIYGYRLFELKTCPCCNHTEEEEIDACWGYYGTNWNENGLFEAAQWEENYGNLP